MEGNVLNQKPCIPSWPGVFQFYIFSVSFWVNRFLFPLSSLFRVVPLLLSYCLSIKPFRYVFLVAIFLSKIVRFLLHPIVSMFSCHPLPVVDRIFFCCFGMSCFVSIVLTFVDISLIFHLSPVLSNLFPQVVLLFFLRCIFLFVSTNVSFVLSFDQFS